MNTELNELIHTLKAAPFAEVHPPCKANELYSSAETLIQSGHAWSHELSSLFLLCNGFYYNGLHLFALTSPTDNNYSLMEQNAIWNIPEKLPGCVLFGRSDEEVYVFNSLLKKYQILDFTGWDEYYAFEALHELLQFVIDERL